MTAPCQDCGRARDYYTAQADAWTAAGASNHDHLCLDCFEARLGRPLSEADFIALPSEITGRFAGEARPPSPPAQRQRELESWRAFIRSAPDAE